MTNYEHIAERGFTQSLIDISEKENILLKDLTIQITMDDKGERIFVVLCSKGKLIRDFRIGELINQKLMSIRMGFQRICLTILAVHNCFMRGLKLDKRERLGIVFYNSPKLYKPCFCICVDGEPQGTYTLYDILKIIGEEKVQSN